MGIVYVCKRQFESYVHTGESISDLVLNTCLSVDIFYSSVNLFQTQQRQVKGNVRIINAYHDPGVDGEHHLLLQIL